jgi:hypothetical protein
MPVQSSIQSVPGVQQQKSAIGRSTQYSVKVKNVEAILPFPHMSLWRDAELIKSHG